MHPDVESYVSNTITQALMRSFALEPSTYTFARRRIMYPNSIPQSLRSSIPPKFSATSASDTRAQSDRGLWPGSRSYLIILLPPARDLHIQYPVYSSAMTSLGGVGSCTAHSTPHPLPPTCFDGKDEEAPVGAALLAFCFANTGPLMTSHLQSLSQRRCGHPPPPHLRKSLTLREVHLQQAQMWETPVSMKVLCVLSRAG